MENLSNKLIERQERPVKVLQFGEGNFLRAFVDWIIDTMNKKGVFNGNVAVVQPMPFGRCAEMATQDGLYTLYLQGKQDGEVVKTHQIIDCISECLNPFADYARLLEIACSEDIEFVISNTTEAGIAYDETDTDLTVTPKSFPGKLLACLKARYEHFNGAMDKGLFIIPCELIDHNGDTLKEILVKLANTCGLSQDFINWMLNANKFYNTLVDRIVPGYPRNEAQQCQEELGYIDNSMVVGEIFHLWCIDGDDIKALEAKFPAPAAGLNVLYVDSIVPYKQRKVKILNGSHTCLVPVSYLAGIDTVGETVTDAQLGNFVRTFIFDEVVPTIDIPRDQMVAFSNSVLERYENPFVRHELLSIALNSVTKYKTRILPAVLQNLEAGKLPKLSLFSLAALIAFYRGKRGEQDIPLKDDQWALDFFEAQYANFDGSKEACHKLVEAFLGLESHWELNLNSLEGVTDFVADCLYEIMTKPMREALAFVGC